MSLSAAVATSAAAVASPATISAAEAFALHMSGKGILLDIREHAERAEHGSVPAAMNLPMSEIPALLAALGHAPTQKLEESLRARAGTLVAARRSNRPVLVLCSGGVRAVPVAQALCSRGINAQVIEHGLQNWQPQGLPLVF